MNKKVGTTLIKNIGIFIWLIIFSMAISIIKNIRAEKEWSYAEKAIIKSVIEESKKEKYLPKRINNTTELSNITSEDRKISYHYILDKVDTDKSDDAIKESLLESTCIMIKQDEQMSYILSKNLTGKQKITLEYSYMVKNSDRKYLFSFLNIYDCSLVWVPTSFKK
jgi:hypothetical protein